MEYYYIRYRNYGVRFSSYNGYSYWTSTFICKNKSYIINKRTSKENIAQNLPLMCDLKNKDSLIYSELLKVIDIINKGELFHIVSREISKRILKTYHIRHKGHININLHSNMLYYDWDFECLVELDGKRFPIIYIEC